MSAPRRILMTVDAVGGVWHYATELAGALMPHGYETILALIGPAPADDQREAVRGLPGISLVETGLALDWLAADEAAVRGSARAVAALARDLDVDLIQLNQPAFAAEAMPAPVIAVAHSCVATWWRAVCGGEMPAGFAWQTRLVRAGLLAAERVACPSAAFAAALEAAYRLPRTPAVVHNGRSMSGAAAGAMHDFALTAGRLWDASKDVATLDRAAAMLGVPFRAAGALAGPNGEAVAVAHLHALGRLDDAALARVLAGRPVFASAALYEPFGLAVLEAAQAGCALVLSDIASFRELWDGVATFVAPGDAAGFARAIDVLIGDAGARVEAGARARRHAARYTPAAMAAGMAGLYRPVLGDARVAA